MPRVLWIEDGACDDIPQLVGPVEVDGGYNLVVALDVSQAVALLRSSAFDAIVVDLRLPPGENPDWVTVYNQQGSDAGLAKLGLELIRSMLSDPDARVRMTDTPAWLRPALIGVLSVDPRHESGIGHVLDRLGVTAYWQKTADLSPTALLDLFNRLCATSAD